MAGPVIYQPKGRAREYAPLACNLYETCPHGCTYCYVPRAMHKSREEFHQLARPRPGIVDRLKKDAERMRDTAGPVLLCFACDPFPKQAVSPTTREAMDVLKHYKVGASFLTKGLVWDDDIEMMPTGWEVGISLTGASSDVEPGASPHWTRIDILSRARDRGGLTTWVSVEPVINRECAIEEMRLALPFVDHWKVGKLNHHKSETNWKRFLKDARKLLKGCQVYWKRDLLEAAGEV